MVGRKISDENCWKLVWIVLSRHVYLVEVEIVIGEFFFCSISYSSPVVVIVVVFSSKTGPIPPWYSLLPCWLSDVDDSRGHGRTI